MKSTHVENCSLLVVTERKRGQGWPCLLFNSFIQRVSKHIQMTCPTVLCHMLVIIQMVPVSSRSTQSNASGGHRS